MLLFACLALWVAASIMMDDVPWSAPYSDHALSLIGDRPSAIMIMGGGGVIAFFGGVFGLINAKIAGALSIDDIEDDSRFSHLFTSR